MVERIHPYEAFDVDLPAFSTSLACGIDIVAKGNSIVLKIKPTTLEFHSITSEQIKKILNPHQIQQLKDKNVVYPKPTNVYLLPKG
jgi:hypothetical protein